MKAPRVAALALALVAPPLLARVLPFDYRCGDDLSLAAGPRALGWVHSGAPAATLATTNAARHFVVDPAMAMRHPLRILLADDNAVNRKLALRLLQRMGYGADVAGDGGEAVEGVERQRCDVVLMDAQMPEMDGLEAARRIVARWPEAERPRIVAMTANAMQGDREQCLAAGMDDYLTKPIRVAELAAMLEQVKARTHA